MADLDDFFAKKDRKKGKTGGRKPEGEGAPRQPEPRPARPPRPPRAEGDPPRPGPTEPTRSTTEEEEWKEYEETVKDYTGLKIQVLQGGANQQGGGNSDGGNSSEEQVGSDSGKTKGPWNKSDQPDQPAPPPVEEAPKPRPEPVAAPPKTSTYQPPSVRRQPLPEVNRRQQNRHAPDIHNDDYFPVLGAAGNKRAGGWSTAAGQQATRGSAQSTRTPLALGNSFTTLDNDS